MISIKKICVLFFGGGRYDDLAENFINEKIPAFGFGMGDVTVRDFLETHALLPALSSSTELYLVVAPETDLNQVYKVANLFREKGINVAVGISNKKLTDQLKSLDKRNISFVMFVGSEELKIQNFTLRNTVTREEKTGTIAELVEIIKA